MDIFKEFKEVFSNVSDELKMSLKIQNRNDYKDLTVYLGRGSVNILERNRNKLDIIHTENLSIVEVVKIADENINKLFTIYTLNYVMVDNLERELANVPQIKFNLVSLNNMIVDISEAFEKVEEDLANLENQIQWEQIKKYQCAQGQASLLYEANCKRKLDAAHVSLAKKHAEHLLSKENYHEKLLLERQRTFELEYQKDLSEYVQKGIIRRESLQSSDIQDRLGEISVEPSNVEALDEFLEGD